MRFAMTKHDWNDLQKVVKSYNWKGGASRYSFVLICLLLLACGCSTVTDLSKVEPYSRYVGRSYCLDCECELFNTSRLFSSFKIVSDAYDGYSKVKLVRKLPKGTVIIIESIKREGGKNFFG